MHGVAQGFIQGVSGGNASQSFLTAAISSIAAGGYGMLGGVTQTGVGQVLFGTVAGGVTARLQGGNFWEGAAIGLTVSLLNHAAHKMDSENDPPKKDYKRFFRMMSKQFANLPTVDSNTSASLHYYNGDFQPVQLGPKTINALINSREYTRVETRLVTGQAQSLNDIFRVDLTFQGAFFVGQTPVSYSTFCNSSACITTFKAFAGDGFRDPLDIGVEIPIPNSIPSYSTMPKPYDFIPYEFSIKYNNPGYPVNR